MFVRQAGPAAFGSNTIDGGYRLEVSHHSGSWLVQALVFTQNPHTRGGSEKVKREVIARSSLWTARTSPIPSKPLSMS